MVSPVERGVTEDNVQKGRQNYLLGSRDAEEGRGLFLGSSLENKERIWLCNHFILGRERKHSKPKMK